MFVVDCICSISVVKLVVDCVSVYMRWELGGPLPHGDPCSIQVLCTLQYYMFCILSEQYWSTDGLKSLNRNRGVTVKCESSTQCWWGGGGAAPGGSR